MTPILIICAVVAGVSLYDFITTRNWQQVTSTVRNDAVFEKRNKHYGAFQIRRDYNRNLLLIVFGLLGAVGIISAATSLRTKEYKPAVEIPLASDNDVIKVNVDEPKKPEPEVIKQKASQPEQQAPMQKVVAPTPTDDPDKGQKFDTDVDHAGPVDVKGKGDEFPTNPDPNPNPGDGKDDKGTPPPSDDPEIPDVAAQFPGGMSQFKPFLSENLNYPQIALEEGRGGKVYLRFIVDRDGEISDVTVIRKTPDCPECDAEAKRVLKRMPKWIPGTKKGKPVKSYFNIPVVFAPK